MNGPLAVTGVLLFVVAVLAALLVDQLGAPPFDRWVTLHIDSWRDATFWGTLFRGASRVGFATGLVPIALVVTVLVAVVRRLLWPVVALVVTNPIVSIVNHALKEWFDRPRPTFDQYQAVGGFSLPSGHAASSAAFAVAVALAVPPGRVRTAVLTVGVAFALVVGISRVVLGVHYTSDVMIGWTEGAGLALVIAALTSARRALPPKATRPDALA